MEKPLTEILRSNNVQTPPLLRLAGRGEGTIYGFPISPTEDAHNLWFKLRNSRRETGYFPVILGGEDDIRHLEERLEFSTIQTVQNEIQKSHAFDLEGWLEKRALAVIRDLFSFNPAIKKFVAFTDFPYIGNRSADVFLGLIPREESWYTPAYLAFGGWIDNPPASVHCALLRRWNRFFGADVVSITKKEICIFIQAPPDEKTTAHQIRNELFMYCADYPEQGITSETGFFESIFYRTYWHVRWPYPWNNDFDLDPPQDNAQNCADN